MIHPFWYGFYCGVASLVLLWATYKCFVEPWREERNRWRWEAWEARGRDRYPMPNPPKPRLRSVGPGGAA